MRIRIIEAERGKMNDTPANDTHHHRRDGVRWCRDKLTRAAGGEGATKGFKTRSVSVSRKFKKKKTGRAV
jgi:hypothetical protein